MALFEKGIRLLENDYLGGSGSRGYGQIKFAKLEKTELSDANDWKA
jgi:CRISPR-associated protein Csm3